MIHVKLSTSSQQSTVRARPQMESESVRDYYAAMIRDLREDGFVIVPTRGTAMNLVRLLRFAGDERTLRTVQSKAGVRIEVSDEDE